MSNDAAREGHLFVCCACGKVSTYLYGFADWRHGREYLDPEVHRVMESGRVASSGWDESCMLNCEEFAERQLVWNADHTRVVQVLPLDATTGEPTS